MPGAEGVTFASGSGGKRMEKGRGAVAAGHIHSRGQAETDPPIVAFYVGNSLTREPFRALI